MFFLYINFSYQGWYHDDNDDDGGGGGSGEDYVVVVVVSTYYIHFITDVHFFTKHIFMIQNQVLQ